jgi:hypothetical protein
LISRQVKPHLLLADITGRILTSDIIHTDENGYLEFSYNISMLEQGYYFGQLKQQDKTFTVEFIVAR